MLRIRPFSGLRPVPALAPQVACVPYDVVDRAESAALAAGKPRLGDGSWMASDPVLSQLYQSRPAAAAAPGRPAEPFIDSTYEELP